MDTADKTRANRLRRMAERQGLRYVANRRRDPLAIDYGCVWLVDAQTNATLCEFTPGDSEGTILDEIEAWLKGNRQ